MLERSERTVRQHAIAVYSKSGLAGRAELAAFFLEDLLLPQQGRRDSDRSTGGLDLERGLSRAAARRMELRSSCFAGRRSESRTGMTACVSPDASKNSTSKSIWYMDVDDHAKIAVAESVLGKVAGQ